MPSEDKELKPCPFCGGEAEERCVVKGKNITANTNCMNKKCILGFRTFPISLWNTRPNDSKPQDPCCGVEEETFINICGECGVDYDFAESIYKKIRPYFTTPKCCGDLVPEIEELIRKIGYSMSDSARCEFVPKSDKIIDFLKTHCCCGRGLSDNLAEQISEYAVHDNDCICSQWRQGKPTDDGDYISQYGYGKNEKWYSRNKKEEPECSCGLDRLLANLQDTKLKGGENGS